MVRAKSSLVITLLALSCAAVHLYSQKPSFEVVSIRPNISGSRSTTTNVNGATLRITNVTVRQLILQSYPVMDSQVVGGPDWITQERFDIQARVDPGPIQISTLPAMMQALLEDRFAFKARHESRELPVFILTVVKDGHKMKGREGKAEVGAGALVQGSATTNGTPAGVEMAGNAITIPRLASMIASIAGRPIIDNTNLNALYDLTLKFVPNVTLDATGPSLFTALEEQLGLKLESSRRPVEVLVIDSVQRPTEN